MKARGARWVLLIAATTMAVSGCSSDASVPSVSRDGFEFVDVAPEVGLDFRNGVFRWDESPDPGAMLGGGVCWLDYDGDGWLDLFAVNSFAEDEAARWEENGGLPRAALFRNDGGEFVDESSDSGADLAIRGNGCVAADFDLDGHTDLYVTSSRAGALLWNEGDGTFTEGARAAGLDAFGWYAGATVADVNQDGWPDIFVAGYVDLNNPVVEATQGFPHTYLGVRDLLYLNEGRRSGDRPTFREVGVEAGLEAANLEYGLGALFSDFDRDGDADLYVANDTTPNRLYDNVQWPGGPGADPAGLGFRFEELAGRAGVADPNSGMGIAAGDFDVDGRSDLFVTNARGQVHAVFQSAPPESVDPLFTDVRAELGVDLGGSTGWGTTWADLDLDADLDLVVVNGDIPVTDLGADGERIRAFENTGGAHGPPEFREAGPAAGLDDVDPLVGRGSAAADFDNDGDQDIAVNSIGGRLALLENMGSSGNWLQVAMSSFLPGTVVTARLPDGVELVREVQAGSSYLSSEDPRVHFGLGNATEVAELTVTGPRGRTTTYRDVAANQVFAVWGPR